MLPQLGAIVSKLRGLADYDSGLADALASLEPAEIQLQEAVYSLSHYAQRLDRSGPARAGRALDALHSTARKFRLPPDTLHEHAARRAQLAALDAAADLGALEAAQSKAWDAYLADAKRLSKARAGGEGARRRGHGRHAGIVDGGRQLRSRARAAGRRRPARARTGRIPRRRPSRRAAAAAREVASGGELARISLALAVIASAASPTPTLIFDEVDTGIGGGVAEVVGRLLHQLGRNRQVLCVTHLPQVAARGDHHFQVAKGADERGGTVSSVIALDKASRVEEVARMLGGLEITATTRKHAKEMLAA
jgi:DNA repair protein RecN (Recombination protein N)